jgi:hypothetical protein
VLAFIGACATLDWLDRKLFLGAAGVVVLIWVIGIIALSMIDDRREPVARRRAQAGLEQP